MAYIEITGVCPSCCTPEHFGTPSKDQKTIYYTCRRCWTSFSRKGDVLVGLAESAEVNGYLGSLTGEGRRPE